MALYETRLMVSKFHIAGNFDNGKAVQKTNKRQADPFEMERHICMTYSYRIC